MVWEKFIKNEDSVPILITTYKSVNSFVKVYHGYKDLWKLFINKVLTTTMEPDNVVTKCAVCVKKNDVIVGYLPHGNNGKLSNSAGSYVFRVRSLDKSNVIFDSGSQTSPYFKKWGCQNNICPEEELMIAWRLQVSIKYFSNFFKTN